MLHNPESHDIAEFYRELLVRRLTQPLRLEIVADYRVPDTRSRFQKAVDWAKWKTVGRFRAWLHRDCGEW